MSGSARTLCSTCGIPTRNADGTCKHCLAEANAARPCLMCGQPTSSPGRVCERPRPCAGYLRGAETHVDRYEDALGSGDWVPARGVRVWRPWEAA